MVPGRVGPARRPCFATASSPGGAGAPGVEDETLCRPSSQQTSPRSARRAHSSPSATDQADRAFTDAAAHGAHMLVLEQDDSLLWWDRQRLFELTRQTGCAAPDNPEVAGSSSHLADS